MKLSFMSCFNCSSKFCIWKLPTSCGTRKML